jgi:ankyrin repeat protein
MRLTILLLSTFSFFSSAANEIELYGLQVKMINESLNSDKPLCYNYGKPYQKVQKELAALVTSSTVSDSEYILEAAVMADSIEDVKRLVKAGAPFITHRLSWGASLLHIAAIHSSPQVINYLNSQGLNVNIIIEDSGVTPLHLAVNSNKRMNIEALVALGADVNIKDVQGSVPIIYTFGCKDKNTFNYLLKKGTDIYPKVIEIADKIGASIES